MTCKNGNPGVGDTGAPEDISSGVNGREPTPDRRRTLDPSPERGSNILDAARAYAAKGWEIFPADIRGKDKKSFKSKKFSNGRNWGKTKDLDEIERDFKRWPKAIGLPTGKVNGIFVTEADTKKGHDVDGIGSLRKLEAEHGPLPDTLRAESPSGSVHYYFNWPKDIEIKTSSGEIAPGVDVRGEGGMVIAPPSVRGDGAYRWLNEGTPIADAPDWLIELASKKGKTKAPRTIEPVPEYLKGKGGIGKSTNPGDVTPPVPLEAIEAALAVIDPDLERQNWIGIGCALYKQLGEEKGFDIWNNWSRRGKKYDVRDIGIQWESLVRGRGYGWNVGTLFHLANDTDPDWREKIETEAQPPAADPAPKIIDAKPAKPAQKEPAKPAQNEPKRSKHEPTPVDLWAKFDPPTLPIGLLPKVLEDFAHEQSELIGGDPSGLAMAALAVCAAAIPDYVKLQPKKYDQWSEAARIWVALIGLPSTKKSPIIYRTVKRLLQIDAEMWREYLKAKAKYESLPSEERKTAEPPKQTRLRIEDTTIEGAQEVLINSPNGVLMLQDELAGWFGSIDKYAGHRGAAKDRGFWLQAYNGGSYALNRIKRGPALIENLSVTILGGIQPEPMRKIATDTIDDGLLQRLIPIVLRPGTATKDEPTSNATDRYEDTVERLLKVKRPFEGLFFDEGAKAIRARLETRHLELMNLESINKKLASHIGKYDGLFVRLCVIWQCIENVEKDVVTEQTANRVAIFLHQFLLPHAIAFYAGVLGLSDDHDRLTAVAGYILARKLHWITNRDVQRGDRTMRGLKRNEIENVFHQLDALGWINRFAGARISDPPRWGVNPEVHRAFAERAAKEAERRERERAMITDLLGGGVESGE